MSLPPNPFSGGGGGGDDTFSGGPDIRKIVQDILNQIPSLNEIFSSLINAFGSVIPSLDDIRNAVARQFGIIFGDTDFEFYGKVLVAIISLYFGAISSNAELTGGLIGGGFLLLIDLLEYDIIETNNEIESYIIGAVVGAVGVSTIKAIDEI